MPQHKKFNKKRAVTFQLVHRSQQDPLVADENAPQRVLLPVDGKESKKDNENPIEEKYQYDIIHDEEYNYLEYLKDSKDHRMEWPDHVESELEERCKQNEKKIQLPSSVFASEVEEEVGMLGKAAPVYGPQLHLDPDLVAAMDDDFDYSDPENQIEDNIMELGGGVASDQEFSGDEELDEVCSLPGSDFSFEQEETKSRFTNYSMTSSVIRRNEQLSLLDAKFEKMFAGYEDIEIGALDCEEIEGHVPLSSDILLQYADEFEKSQKTEKMDDVILADKIKEQLEIGSDEDEELVALPVPEKEKWDCESILSTYSNIYNHPKLIEEPKASKIRIHKKTGIPENVLGSNRLTQNALNKLNEENGDFESKGAFSVGQSVISQLSNLSIRPKNELPEERRERKKQLKEYRRERRLEKKMNTAAFKEEAKRQVKISVNNKNNVQGNKIL
ncbi:LTV1 ribosome biogenesis factor [Leptinotarsa decemlineata]|uniref:LTV1 ribosome biogenesis factor n=1 Tax=Leptinotarsa decemlineata TaxID=7539 RepID=UPI003D30B6F1